MASLTLLLFLGLVGQLTDPVEPTLERMILDELLLWHLPFLDTFFRILTWLGSFYLLGPLAALLTIVLFAGRHKWRGYYFSAVFYGASLTTYLLKRLIARDRPGLEESAVIMLPLDSALPSGHSTQALAFALPLAVILWNRGRS
ncbi:phosphatase PAP2 family protein [Kineobactrum salinum]|uniref:Phosphatase PAP2 family protein n=1 Tax=Kineobactrum salinum TaxID=2708301 RepID=A0A6C0U4I5_9GAMM|nr:hypothetical protein [Kineobactrum salinum]QIB65305.1 hypothetical protein G3T16_07725 [Kineobactrum salinum]